MFPRFFVCSARCVTQGRKVVYVEDFRSIWYEERPDNFKGDLLVWRTAGSKSVQMIARTNDAETLDEPGRPFYRQ